MTQKQSWLAALAIYRDRRMACILVLGFSSGLPLALTGATLALWLAKLGIDKTTIGLFALVGLPYTLKFLWAPAIDGLSLPILTRLLGRRRSWAILTQLALAASVLALGAAEPGIDIGRTAILALLVAFCSASQDIVVDAYRVEILQAHEQGAGAAAIQIGYRVGMLASGAGALYIADGIGWMAAFWSMAALVGVGMAAILLNPEPAPPAGAAPADSRTPAQWFAAHVIKPFGDFLSRPGWAMILLFILLFKFGDAVAGVMTSPFYIELGFSLTEIANVSKIFGLTATVSGAIIGGVIVARLGIMPALVITGILQMASNLMFVAQAAAGYDIGMLTLTIAVENLSGGMGTAAFVAYLSSLCNFAFTATQYALLSSFMAVGRTVLSSSGGWLADRMDWISFFLLSTAAALPGLLLLLWMIKRFPAERPATS